MFELPSKQAINNKIDRCAARVSPCEPRRWHRDCCATHASCHAACAARKTCTCYTLISTLVALLTRYRTDMQVFADGPSLPWFRITWMHGVTRATMKHAQVHYRQCADDTTKGKTAAAPATIGLRVVSCYNKNLYPLQIGCAQVVRLMLSDLYRASKKMANPGAF